MLSRRSFLSAAASPILAAQARPLNFVFILIDDYGWRDTGYNGSRYYETPNIDALARSAMTFTNGYAAAPVCSPTRAALMTGKWPARLHLTAHLQGHALTPPHAKLRAPVTRKELPLSEVTIAEILKQKGYATASIGKWHLGDPGFLPTDQGFDVNFAGTWDGSPKSFFYPGWDGKPAGVKGRDGEYLTDLLTDQACDWLKKQRSNPFFLYLPHYTVHIPLQAKEEVIEKYPADPKFTGKQNSSVYAAMLESLDDGIGRIMAKLDELKLKDNTLVIFTSDNGGLVTLEGPHTPATSNAPLREGKGYLYEGGIRVPLIMHWPAKIKTGEINGPVSSIDLLPTILDACELPRPDNVDGETIIRFWPRPGEPIPDPAIPTLYWHYPHYSNQGGKPGGAMRFGNWKLIEFYENGRRELYDLSKSPNESRNLAAEQPQIVAELAAKLDAWRKATAADMPTSNPDYVPNPPAGDGSITLPARWAEVHGVQLRYEPLPHKNTLGFWVNVDDYATWEFTATKPGRYDVEVWQGCGTGQGGSTAEVSVGRDALTFTVEDTGHFQNFRPRVVGSITIDKPGRHTLTLRPKSKAKAAVMDVRQIVLRPAK